jgi:hypothetical protein
MIKVSSPALLAYLTFPVPERIGGTYDAIIVNGKYDWYIMPLQDRQNGTGNLSPDQMHMCQVRTFLLYQLFQLPGCFPVIEIIDDVFTGFNSSLRVSFDSGKYDSYSEG